MGRIIIFTVHVLGISCWEVLHTITSNIKPNSFLISLFSWSTISEWNFDAIVPELKDFCISVDVITGYWFLVLVRVIFTLKIGLQIKLYIPDALPVYWPRP